MPLKGRTIAQLGNMNQVQKILIQFFFYFRQLLSICETPQAFCKILQDNMTSLITTDYAKLESLHQKTKNSNGELPLHIAIKEDNLEVCGLILCFLQDKLPKNEFGYTPLHQAAQIGQVEVVKLYFDQEIGRAHV